jgi:hypothetical protein
MDLNLAGRTAIVTGGSKGIGRAIALTLAAEGCHLHLAARGADALNAVREEVAAKYNVNVTTHAYDLSQSDQLHALAEGAADADILINNAGAIPAGRIGEIDEARWREAWDLKLFGYINLCRAMYAAMKKRGRGVIINVIGTGGERPTAGYIAGAGANAGLIAFTRALGGESHRDNLRVLGINPGLTETERMRDLGEQMGRGPGTEGWDKMMGAMPFGRPGMPEEVADLAAFLASDRAAYINGTIVTIDGGHAARA